MNFEIQWRGVAATAAVGLSLVACGDPLKDGQLLEEVRPLGVRFELENGLSTPAPGESAEVVLLFAGPTGPVDLRLALEICQAEETARGTPICIGTPWVAQKIDVVGSEGRASFSVPEHIEPGSRIGIRAVGCETGEPELTSDPLDWNCGGQGEPIEVGFDGVVRSGSFENQNPRLVQSRLFVADAEITFEDVGVRPTCEEGVLEVEAGKKLEFQLRLDPGAREELSDDAGEILQISHFSTAGLLERQFSIVDGSEDLVVDFTWKAPKESGAVKQYAVVRDGRGGVAWLSYSLCVQ